MRGELQIRWGAEHVGPLAELLGLAKSGHVPSWLVEENVDLGSLQWLAGAVASKGKRFTSSVGVTPAIMQIQEEFFAFVRHAANCAKSAGFPDGDADKLASALGELRGNIEEHSERPDSGFLFYAGSSGRFEIGAVDQGIGALRSLRQCAEHTHLSNDGDALQLAIREGGSRYGSNSNRGYGFRPIFVGLANHSGHLRFRSGGYALEIDGQSPKPMLPTTLSQKPICSGLSVCVTCCP